MKRLGVALLGVLLLGGCQDDIDINLDLRTDILIHSRVNNRDYKIWIQLPDDYSLNNSMYETLYLLDAKTDMDFVSEKCKSISQHLDLKNVIVVGIGYGNDRKDDYTPTKTNMGNGNSPQFLDFIKTELIPHIEEEYRVKATRSSRIILGHSYGGLCGTYAFVKHNETFGNYILLSSSLFYDNDIVLQYELDMRQSIKNNSNVIYIGVGGTERELIVANNYLNQILQKYYLDSILKFEIIEGKGHRVSKRDNIEQGLLHYFNNRIK